jgi:uncharacterized membrane protein YtjA (UPF0391 family)
VRCHARADSSPHPRARNRANRRERSWHTEPSRHAFADLRGEKSDDAVGTPLGLQCSMLQAALALFLIAIVAALFGFGGLAAGAAGVAKIVMFVFLALAVVSLVIGLIRRPAMG